MKQLIMDVLEDMSTGQINLESEAARELITNTIMAAIKTDGGWFLDLSTLDNKPKLDIPIYEKTDEQNARETWVCYICGENTFDVDYEYIGSGTNHLGCELKVEMSSSNDAEFDDADYYTGPDGHYERYGDISHELMDSEPFSVVDNLGYDTKDKKQKKIGEITKQQYRNLLSEQIVDNKGEGYIYESPDGGETVYKREVGSDKKELVWSSDEKRKFNG